MSSRVRRARRRYGIWKGKRQYRKIVEHVQQHNNCPICGTTHPEVVKVYQNVTPRAYEEDKPWMASMICSKQGCNTAWSAPQSLAGLLDFE